MYNELAHELYHSCGENVVVNIVPFWIDTSVAGCNTVG